MTTSIAQFFDALADLSAIYLAVNVRVKTIKTGRTKYIAQAHFHFHSWAETPAWLTEVRALSSLVFPVGAKLRIRVKNEYGRESVYVWGEAREGGSCEVVFIAEAPGQLVPLGMWGMDETLTISLEEFQVMAEKK